MRKGSVESFPIDFRATLLSILPQSIPNVPDRAISLMERHACLLLEEGRVTNLTRILDPREMIERHFAGTRDAATCARLPWHDRPLIEDADDDRAFLAWLAPSDDPRWDQYFAFDLTVPRFYSTEEFYRWHELSYDLGLVQIFDWGRWSACWDRTRDAPALATLSLADALRVFTWICRSDRTNEGTIELALEEGQLAALVEVVRRHVASGGGDAGRPASGSEGG